MNVLGQIAMILGDKKKLDWLTEFVTLRFVRLVGDISVWMLLTFHVCCLLNCHQNSRSVPIVPHSDTDFPAHHKLIPIAIEALCHTSTDITAVQVV